MPTRTTVRTRQRGWWPIGICLWVACSLAHQTVAEPALRPDSDYLHVVYNIGSNNPVRVYDGKLALDLTTRERWRQVLGELKELGVNVTAPLTSYGPQTIYPTGLPELRQCAGWAERNLDALKMLLDTCRELGIDCYPAIWLYRAATPDLCDKATRELVGLYGRHPAFTGIVPPVEANPQYGIQSDDFIKLSRLAKQLKPGVTVMDYPNGPFSFEIMQTIIARSLSGQVDIQNVQFHPSDYRWDGDFLYARGLFHLVHGLCPGIKWIVHTHYKYGGQRRWIELDDLYRVTQAATITATPHGTSIFSFLHSMWGNASSTNLDDPMERRLAWYKGILNAQRLVPYFEDAVPANAVAIMIPQYIRESSDSLLRKTYVPLAREGIGCHFFVNQENMGDRVEVVVVHGLRDCSPEQLRLLQQFVGDGGALCVLHSASPAVPDNLSERTKRILGVPSIRSWEAPELDAAFAEALGLDLETGKLSVDAPRETRYGKGTLDIVPLSPDLSLAELLSAWTTEHAPSRTIVEGDLDGFTVDTWHRAGRAAGLDIVMFMGTTAGATARDVQVSIATEHGGDQACLLTPDSATPLTTRERDGRVEVTVPELGDEFNAVIFATDAHAFIAPGERLVRCRAGQRVAIPVKMQSVGEKPFRGTGSVRAPEGWPPPDPASFPIALSPGEGMKGVVNVTVPRDATRRPYFIRVECEGLTQRMMLFPEDGKPQTFTDIPPEEIAKLTQKPKAPTAPFKKIGTEWIALLADDPEAFNPAANRPGVCLLPGKEWDAPAEHDGKIARYAERIPRLGAPNFLVNEPPEGDLEIRLAYWTKSGGTVNVYDGKEYHAVAELAEKGTWAEATGIVPAKYLTDPRADRPQYPGVNVMLDVNCADVYLHKIEVRAAPE